MNNSLVTRTCLLMALALACFLMTAPSIAAVNHAQYQWNARTGTWPASGSVERMRGSIAVTADSDTGWSVSGLPSWISVVSGSPWTGSGVATFQLAQNFGTARTASLNVGGFNFEVYQAAGTCGTSVSPESVWISPGGVSQRTFNVASNGTCFWTTTVRPSWITLMTAGDTGSGVVVFSAGSTSFLRSGAIIAGSSVFTVDQSGTQPCNFVPSPLSYDWPAAGGVGTFDLFLNNSCGSWNLRSDNSWVTVNTPSGTGSGTATYTVAANPHGDFRQAVLIVNNQPHFVNQAPNPTPGYMTLQPGPVTGQDTSWGSGYFQHGTPDDPLLTYGGSNDAFHDYFSFNLTGAYPAMHVAKVDMQLYVTGRAPTDPGLQLWHLTQPWTEGSVSAASNPAGVVIRNLPAFTAGWNSIDVTDLFKRWQTGAYSNFGVKIAPAGIPMNARGYLASAENANSAIRPRLVITYMDDPLGSSLAVHQNLRVVGGSGYQELYYNFDTRETSVSPYAYSSGSVPFALPRGQWVGMYHYDYATGRFSQGVYLGHKTIN